MADPCSAPKQAQSPGHRESVTPLSPGTDLQVNGIKTLGPKGTYKMSWGSVTFQYFLDFGGGGVGEGKLSLAGVLFLLEFGTLSAGYSESQITLSFSLPSSGLHWQPDGIMDSLRSNSCGQECAGCLPGPCALTMEETRSLTSLLNTWTHNKGQAQVSKWDAFLGWASPA